MTQLKPEPEVAFEPGPAQPAPAPIFASESELDVNMAVTVTGAFGENSPFHNWIKAKGDQLEGNSSKGKGKQQHRLTYGTSDPTEREIIETIRRILRNKNAGQFHWNVAPESHAYVRVDASIWVGMPGAPGNWPRFKVRPGWCNTTFRKDAHPVEHVGDPRLCPACERGPAVYDPGEISLRGISRVRARGTGSGRVSRARGRGRGRGRGKGRAEDMMPPSPGNPSTAPIGPQQYGENIKYPLEGEIAGPADAATGQDPGWNYYTNPPHSNTRLGPGRPPSPHILSDAALKIHVDLTNEPFKGSSANIGDVADTGVPSTAERSSVGFEVTSSHNHHQQQQSQQRRQHQHQHQQQPQHQQQEHIKPEPTTFDDTGYSRNNPIDIDKVAASAPAAAVAVATGAGTNANVVPSTSEPSPWTEFLIAAPQGTPAPRLPDDHHGAIGGSSSNTWGLGIGVAGAGAGVAPVSTKQLGDVSAETTAAAGGMQTAPEGFPDLAGLDWDETLAPVKEFNDAESSNNNAVTGTGEAVSSGQEPRHDNLAAPGVLHPGFFHLDQQYFNAYGGRYTSLADDFFFLRQLLCGRVKRG
ncbi:hypothetical protein F5Y17DRAFT_252847 [Xylariaceae sp. FL0594]|nr:hypothetical protein F5Y17DRAFT_252847 [Xylariaceae sp. FL0594]